MSLEICNLRKSFGDLKVLKGISLILEEGKIYCLMGPSGSGKTSSFLPEPESG